MKKQTPPMRSRWTGECVQLHVGTHAEFYDSHKGTGVDWLCVCLLANERLLFPRSSSGVLRKIPMKRESKQKAKEKPAGLLGDPVQLVIPALSAFLCACNQKSITIH
ncbi:hypothetical protein OUZ56_008401 [Daphnia magna]|uniref:Uncharacterized protein n=1 Tax=Daphnia magna TaxID=35525 RepID=A0ABR0AD30_9CRUS|nr:hypothetical protein OUZ56_008401 [Daphnia magna]